MIDATWLVFTIASLVLIATPGQGAIFPTSEWLLVALKFVGATYLIYLGLAFAGLTFLVRLGGRLAFERR